MIIKEAVMLLMTYLIEYAFQIKQDLNLSVFNMITDVNESKTLAKHISCECKCKFHGTKCKSNKRCNSNKCWCECKKIHICQKYYVWVLLPVLMKMENI